MEGESNIDHQLVSSGEFLTFILGDEEYGVDILSVQGIQGWTGTTRIPDAPPYMLGVINLRGAIVPIIDLRVKFELKSAEFNSTTVVIVVKAYSGEKEHIIGLVVDAVSEVYKFDVDSIQRNPELSNEQVNDFVEGLISIDEKMVIILDINKLASEWSLDIDQQESAA